jgi:hypothetical protein
LIGPELISKTQSNPSLLFKKKDVFTKPSNESKWGLRLPISSSDAGSSVWKNLTASEKARFFHTDDPASDDEIGSLNHHYYLKRKMYLPNLPMNQNED